MLFSIIIPVYNVEEYIADCLESVRKQSFTDYEVIMVDDGSPDGSASVCDEYAGKDSRFRVIHKENGGLSSARNTGIANAEGEYIIFLDSDDLITEDALESLSAFVRNGEDVAVTEVLNVRDPDNCDYPESLYDAPSCTGKRECLDFILKRKPNVQASVQYIVKRSLLDGHNIRFEEGYYHEDNVYTPWMLSCAESFSFYTGVWYVRRYGRTGSITSGKNVKRILDVIQLSSLYVQSGRFSNLERHEKELIDNTIIGAMWWHLYAYNSYSDAEKQSILETIRKNERVFQLGKGAKLRSLYLTCRVLGFDRGLTLLSAVKERL